MHSTVLYNIVGQDWMYLNMCFKKKKMLVNPDILYLREPIQLRT
jgi:hypothetical protein